MAGQLLLARHGEAHAAVRGTITANTCAGLTETGTDQAHRLARHLVAHQSDSPIARIYSSPILRARQTAAIIGESLELAAVIHEDLRPPDPGELADTTWPEARRKWPADPDNPDRQQTPNTETWEHYLDRATTAIQELIDTKDQEAVLVVGHSETIAASFAYFLGVGHLHRAKYTVEFAALTTWQRIAERPNVTATHQRWALVAHNDNHLVDCVHTGEP